MVLVWTAVRKWQEKVKCRSGIVPDVPVKRQAPPVDHRRLATPVWEAVRLLLGEMETVMFTQTLRP